MKSASSKKRKDFILPSIVTDLEGAVADLTSEDETLDDIVPSHKKKIKKPVSPKKSQHTKDSPPNDQKNPPEDGIQNLKVVKNPPEDEIQNLKVVKKTEKKKKEKPKKDKHKKNQTKQETPKSKSKTTSTTQPRSTVSIALPGSIIANAQSAELKTYLAGQIARALTIFKVDEVVIFSDSGQKPAVEPEFRGARKGDPNLFLARVLQYLETPQYLRKLLFPVHPDLKYAGLLNPLDAPHHVRATEDSMFREGVVVKRPVTLGKGYGSWVNVGFKQDAKVDRTIPPGVRVTVKINDYKGSTTRKEVTGIAVSPNVPRDEHGIYWGYTTRVAESLGEVWSKCSYEGGYDLSIGTSERGENIYKKGFTLPAHKHLLIVFGGLKGLEAALEADETLTANNPRDLFDFYLNTCPEQGSRTIRTEEAIPLSLTALYPFLLSIKSQ